MFGSPGGNLGMCDLPYPMRLSWKTSVVIHRFACHRLVVRPLKIIFEDTLAHYGLDEIERLGLDIFGGCFSVRAKRGGTSPSMHSWGIAVDIDPARNKLDWNGDRAELAKPDYKFFWKTVEQNSGISLGRTKDYDWMHFQFARLDDEG